MLHLPLYLIEVILFEFEKKFRKYEVETFRMNELEKVIVLNNSLVLYIGIRESNSTVSLNEKEMSQWKKKHPFMKIPKSGKAYYTLKIEELTTNEIGFKHVHSRFIEKMEAILSINYLGLDIEYSRFKGYSRLYWCEERETLAERMNKEIPELRLKERYEEWEGYLYHFIVMEMLSLEGKRTYAVAYTTQSGKEWLKKKINFWTTEGMSPNDNTRMKSSKYRKVF